MPQNFENLWHLVKSLRAGSAQEVSLKEKSWMQSIGGCDIKFRVGDRDEGIRQHGRLSFECVLAPDGWKNVEGLLEPFCEPNTSGYQWLIHSGKISLLLSRDGQW